VDETSDVEAMRELAAAVVAQAMRDLRGTHPTVSQSARNFLLRDLWAPGCVWGELLQLNRARVVARAEQVIAGAELAAA